MTIDEPTEGPNDGNDPFVRPYVITRGRTVGRAGHIPIEALIIARYASVGLRPDYANHADVVELCRSPLSIAEIAMHLRQPVGVVRVLAADLTASGYVQQFDTAESEDPAIVRRLVDGIRAL